MKNYFVVIREDSDPYDGWTQSAPVKVFEDPGEAMKYVSEMEDPFKNENTYWHLVSYGGFNDGIHASKTRSEFLYESEHTTSMYEIVFSIYHLKQEED